MRSSSEKRTVFRWSLAFLSNLQITMSPTENSRRIWKRFLNRNEEDEKVQTSKKKLRSKGMEEVTITTMDRNDISLTRTMKTLEMRILKELTSCLMFDKLRNLQQISREVAIQFPGKGRLQEKRLRKSTLMNLRLKHWTTCSEFLEVKMKNLLSNLAEYLLLNNLTLMIFLQSMTFFKTGLSFQTSIQEILCKI